MITTKKQLHRIDLIFKNENDCKEILRQTLSRSNQELINDMVNSGIKGRGGAGFPTGLKWKLTAEQKAEHKYVICNADEGEPGTFKDREILSRVPHKVLAGMGVCAKIIGAQKGYIYLRGEYKFLVPELKKELRKFHDILDELGLNFRVSIFMGSGAYICGEESALFESMEGKRGEPRNKPPFPTEIGYRNSPTVINNVETLAHSYTIFKYGAKKFRDLGVQDSRGSKVFSVSGDTPIPGIYELELGMSVQDFVDDFGDGDTKAVQVGGASGFLVPRKRFGKTNIGYQGKLTGISLPTGGSMMIFNSSRSMYNVLNNYLDFFQEESCVPEMAEGHSFYAVGGLSVSPDNNILAYSVDTVSRRKYTIYFKNLKSGELFEDEIPNTTGGIVWANDNKTIFYTTKHPETLLPYRVFKHVLGSKTEEDELVYEEKDNTYYTFCYKTKSKKYIVIGMSSTLSAEYRIIDADKPNSEFKVFHPREKEMEYSVDHYKDHFYIRTNWNAKNFCLMKTPVAKTGKENWEMVIPNRNKVFLGGFEIFANHLVVNERENGLNQLRIRNWKSGDEHYLDFGEETYDAWISMNPEFETPVLRYGYTSLTTPTSTLDYNMDTKEKNLLKQQEVVGDFDKDNYEAKRLWATAEDGTKVPISIVYRKGLKFDGTNPLLLTAYGSYGANSDDYFSSVRLSLLDRGFIYATAKVRGGQEMGRYWYEEGKLLNKKNTFTDFIACTEFLIKEKIAAKDKVFAWGGSAGGLLMGAIANMRPELYRGIIAAVPFVDVVTTMLDETIPLTTGEFDEWGNPKEKKYYDYMLSYSPYDNVEEKDYPAMLVTTGLHDSQVQYWEPAKWVAKLREMKTDDNTLIMKINMDFGHGGASGRFERYKEVALEYAFVMDQLGIQE